MTDEPPADCPSVLIVEDDDDTRAAMTAVMRRNGYRTIPVASADEGLARLDGQSFAILDLNLPDAPGTTVLARIRARGLPIHVAVTTGTTDPAVLDEVRRLGPEMLMFKPIDVLALLEWMHAAAGE